MEYLIGLLVLAFGSLFYFVNKNKSLTALLSTLSTDKKVNSLEANITKNEALESIETSKREEIQSNLEKDKSSEPSNEQIADYFNNLKP